MSRSTKWPPAIQFHRASGQDRIRIHGKDHYLGPHGSDEAREKYLRLVAEHGGRAPAFPPPTAGAGRGLTVADVAAHYLDMMKARYPVREGNTCEYRESGYALRDALALYGSVPATEFGPRALKAVRQSMRDKGLCVGVANNRTGRIRRAFKWATEEELIPPSVWHALRSMRRIPQPASRPKPVPAGMIGAVLPHVSAVVRDMIQFQRLTGCRPGEMCIMRPRDIDRSGDVWIYRPTRHKTTWKGGDRSVLIGPNAQAVLEPYLGRAPDSFLFSPREAAAERGQQGPPKKKKRRPRKAHPRRRPGERYRTGSYNYAVQRGCERAFPHPALVAIAAKDLPSRIKARELRAWRAEHAAELDQWRKAHRFHVHQLRHTAATTFRAVGGLDAAQSLLGHERRETTEIYAELPAEAVDVVRRVG